jgi:hypothetical protein
LLLHQNKVPFPSVAEFDVADLAIDLNMVAEANVPNHKSGMIAQANIDSIRQLSRPKNMKQKTLLELAQGDVDLLDDLNTSNSALENTHIEIDGFIDNALQSISAPAHAQMTAPQEQVQSSS